MAKQVEKLQAGTHVLKPLQVGDLVRIQNQTGSHPNKWDKTGTVVQVGQNDQYIVKVDGSWRLTLRNRKFLRKMIPRSFEDVEQKPASPNPIPLITSDVNCEPTKEMSPDANWESSHEVVTPTEPHPEPENAPNNPPGSSPPAISVTPPALEKDTVKRRGRPRKDTVAPPNVPNRQAAAPSESSPPELPMTDQMRPQRVKRKPDWYGV